MQYAAVDVYGVASVSDCISCSSERWQQLIGDEAIEDEVWKDHLPILHDVRPQLSTMISICREANKMYIFTLQWFPGYLKSDTTFLDCFFLKISDATDCGLQLH
jgi:hypothetical protein